MPHFKRQHFLPCVYLKNFSPDGSKATRESFVWRLDPTGHRFVPVRSQCAGDYLFSKKTPQQSEQEFQKIEDGYAAALAKVWSGEPPNSYEYFALMLASFDLYSRNKVHMNLTGLEGREAYNLRTGNFINQLILRNESARALTTEELQTRLAGTWKVRLFRSSGGDLITSDNPALCFTWGPSAAIDFILVPVTSEICAAVFNATTTYVLGNELTETDGGLLLNALASHCGGCVYLRSEPEENLIACCREVWRNRVVPVTRTDNEKWELNLIVPPLPNAFSFIRPIAKSTGMMTNSLP